MTQKHTQGPFKIGATRHTPDGTFTQILGAPEDGIEHNRHLIAEVLQFSGDYEAEGQANAALIAAAPDLLEALKLVEDLVRNGNFIGSEDLEKFQAAISKAEGK